MTQAATDAKTESTFETTIERGPDAIKEQFPPPGIAPDWQFAKAAQFKYTRLQRRTQVVVPAMAFFASGIAIGVLSLPLVLKAVLAAAAILIAAQAVAAQAAQRRRMDEVYDLVKPDKIKITKE